MISNSPSAPARDCGRHSNVALNGRDQPRTMIASGNPNPVLPPRATWFKPGQSGNPGGGAAGIRKRLTGDFLRALSADFALHGKDTIERLRIEEPKAYIGAVVRLCPRELEVTQAFDGADNDEMKFILALAKQYVQARRSRTIEATEGEIETPK